MLVAPSPTTTEVKFFKILGGNTVLQFDGDAWARWDLDWGLVTTDIAWDETHSQLVPISKEDAIALML